jgi:hypothetical protein
MKPEQHTEDKKPYSPPRLQRHGDLRHLTKVKGQRSSDGVLAATKAAAS